ncbi:hypothetical protein CTEN210_18098 [Chaetoceros tenuissimus]|uniref:Uncharacterized protein n=1 Tax=Chaetoceros tenuissimus TaxID=426638 RepID=A0AAD3HF48_9STRA|nr:hypothetical protein CTEN210_18098 [Chaetoceros tenuissimus]
MNREDNQGENEEGVRAVGTYDEEGVKILGEQENIEKKNDDDDRQMQQEQLAVDEEDHIANTSQQESNTNSVYKRALHILDANFIPDEKLTHIKGIQIFESVQAVRLLKFIVMTFVSMLIMHAIVRALDWEHDVYYSIRDFFHYDFGTAILYTTVLGIIGRVHDKKGVDRLSFFLPLLIGSILTSASTNIEFLRNSITFYNVSCTWPWTLFVFAAIILLLLGWISFLHIRNTIRDQSWSRQLVEILLIVLFFILPKVLHGHFHLHHYYSFWMLGMIFNRQEWYDQLMFAICVGQFVNGISVYGIDPVHTCRHVLHASISNHCISVKADGGDINEAIELWGSEWIESMLGNGTADVCFGRASSVAPDPSDCDA